MTMTGKMIKIPEVERQTRNAVSKLISNRPYWVLWRDNDWEHVYVFEYFHNDETLHSEEKELIIHDIRINNYENVEEDVDNEMDWEEERRESVSNRDTLESFDSRYDDNHSELREKLCDNESYASYNVFSWASDIYSEVRNSTNTDIYYYNQFEDCWHTAITNIDEFNGYLEQECIDKDNINSDLLEDIEAYFTNKSNKEYEYIQ